MNWEDIKQNYPKAHNALLGPVRNQKTICYHDGRPDCIISPDRDNDGEDIKWYDRYLYDFFDELGIHICPFYDDENEPAVMDYKMYGYRLFDSSRVFEPDGPVHIDSRDKFATRPDAEHDAFNLAFMYLERNMNHERWPVVFDIEKNEFRENYGG